LTFIGLAVAALNHVLSSMDKELQEAIAETDRLDPGWRIPELALKRAVIPDEENSALVLMAAHGLLPTSWPYWDFPRATQNQKRSNEEAQISQHTFWDLEPCVQLDQCQGKALRDELGRAGDALAAARKVANKPRGRYSNSTIRFDTYRIGHLLAYDVLLRAQDKDMDEALTSCRAVLNCGRSIGDEPELLPVLARIDLNRLAAKMIERTLAQGEISEAVLSSIQRDLEEEAEQPLFLIAARGERARMDQWMQDVQTGVVKPNWPLSSTYDPLPRLRLPAVLRNARATLLKRSNRYVELAKLPIEQQVGPIVEMSNELSLDQQGFPFFARPQLDAQIVMFKFHPNCAVLRCAAGIVAVERYRLANKRWPDSLISLVPAYLPRMLLDPYTGEPLRYRRLDDGVVIYSVGRDGQDNGGKLADATEIETDLGFRLWDVPQRRQPPKSPGGN
jgi:hypothetical protein